MTNQTIQLQSIGNVPAIAASEMKAGDVRMFNFGSTTLILKVIEKSDKTLTVIEFNPETGNYWIGDIRKTTKVAIVERDQDVSAHQPQEANKVRKGMIDVSEYFPIVEVVEEVVTVEETPVVEVKHNNKVTIESITFNYSESPTIKENTTVSTFEEANTIIFNAACHMESGRGYYKTGFIVKWVDGQTYEGRMDIQPSHTSSDTLEKHMLNFATGMAGLNKPSHYTDEDYNNYLNAMKSDREGWKEFINTYAFGDIKVEDVAVEAVVTVEETIADQTQSSQEVAVTEESNATYYQLNDEQNGVEIYFASKPDEEVRNQLKANKFRWSRNKACWYAKQSDDTLSFAKQVTEGEQQQNNTNEPVTYPEIDINDVESYVIDQTLQDREHDSGWIFRSQKTNHTEKIQSYFTECNEKVLQLTSTTDNEYCIYKLKEALQSHKKKYHAQYISYLTSRANTPSWAITGRGNINVNSYNKKMDRQDKIMLELAAIPEEFNNFIIKYKNKIKRDNKNKINADIQYALSQPLPELDFTATSKEIDLYGNGVKSKVRFYAYGNYSAANVHGAWRIYYKSVGNELYSLKSNGTLKQAKEYIRMLVVKDNEKIAN